MCITIFKGVLPNGTIFYLEKTHQEMQKINGNFVTDDETMQFQALLTPKKLVFLVHPNLDAFIGNDDKNDGRTPAAMGKKYVFEGDLTVAGNIVTGAEYDFSYSAGVMDVMHLCSIKRCGEVTFFDS